MKTKRTGSPWYRVPTVWLVVSIPALTVLGCMLTVGFAISNPDPILGKTLRQAQAEMTE